MIYTIAAFSPEHAMDIINRNGKALPIPEVQLIQSYMIPGSQALTLLEDGVPIACGGIINQDWRNGEAWLLNSIEFCQNLKMTWRVVREMLPVLANKGNFKRVQAHSLEGKCSVIKHLRFQYEGTKRRFSIDGQDATFWSRLFPEG